MGLLPSIQIGFKKDQYCFILLGDALSQNFRDYGKVSGVCVGSGVYFPVKLDGEIYRLCFKAFPKAGKSCDAGYDRCYFEVARTDNPNLIRVVKENRPECHQHFTDLRSVANLPSGVRFSIINNEFLFEFIRN